MSGQCRRRYEQTKQLELVFAHFMLRMRIARQKCLMNARGEKESHEIRLY